VTNELQMVEFAYSIYNRCTVQVHYVHCCKLHITCVHGGMCVVPVVPVPGTVGTSYIINGEELATCHMYKAI
jgi:hypothetical protein